MQTEQLLMVVLIAFACITAQRLKTLTSSGAVTAFVVGIAVFYGFGIPGFLLLGSFFITSSLWSKWKKEMKGNIEEKLAKGSTRDWRQVLANGGLAASCAWLYSFIDHQLLMVAFAVAISSANSDTWASEIGSLSKKNPIDILTLKRVPKGTSGAISLIGTFAALIGSLFIAFLSYLLLHVNLLLTLIVFLFGFIGNIVDTFIGACYQQKYYCEFCKTETEKKVHCGMKTIRIKGYALIDNDMVNFLSGLISVLLAISAILMIK